MQESIGKQADLSKLNLDSADKLSRIRDLIFGQQSREYDQKIEQHRRELTRISNEVSRVGEMVRALESSFNAQLKALSEQLTSRMDEQNRRQTQMLDQLGQDVNLQLQMLEEQQLKQVNALELAMHQSEESVLAEMRSTAERLHDQKADRIKLGSLLIDIGNTLKVHDSAEVVTDLLQELVATIE
ncbi:MAG: hypothetical protein U0175_32545 [Caldilineaceae bacterium]